MNQGNVENVNLDFFGNEEVEMSKIKLVLPLNNLQFFADGDDDGGQNDDQNQDKDQKKDDDKGKMYTEEELQAIVQQRLAREKKAAEQRVKEAEKLAKMNEEERKQHEFETLQKELEELRAEKERVSLSKEAAKMFAEHDITADDELLDLVVRTTAEDTQASVNAVVKIVKNLVDVGVKAKLAGTAPKTTTSNKALTKEEIRAIKDPAERARLIAANPHLYENY